jgi:hypothetical protein
MSFPTSIPEREAYILQKVKAGEYEVTWGTVTSTSGDHTATFTVMADALKVEGVRVNVSARLEQQLADYLGCRLLTPKLADLIWVQRTTTLLPYPRPITSSTDAMLEHSKKIEAAIILQGGLKGLAGTVGKHWVLDKNLSTHPGRAENYGWHFVGNSFQGILGEVCVSQIKNPTTGSYYRLIQGRGWAHDISHVDYSQTCVLVSGECCVDGVQMPLDQLLADPVLAPLASHNGPLTFFRQPGVPE